MLQKILTIFSQPVITFSVVLLGLFIIHRISSLWIKTILLRKQQKPAEVKATLSLWRYGYWGLAIIFLIAGFSGSLAALGLSAAFIGMVLGWSLQRPVTGLAAWLMIILKRPFKIGNRVIIAGIIGDVTDISPMYIVLNQVGGTVGGEEQSGRGVLIPTAVLFDQVVYNYTLDTEYILDEVSIRLTYDSDWDEAEKILVTAAKQITPEIIQTTGQQPYIRAGFFDAGVVMWLRYNSIPARRQEIASEITKIVFLEFAKNQKVRFSYPHMELIRKK